MIQVTLPYPPSTNNLYVTRGNRRVKSQEAVGDGKEKPEQAGVDDWLHATDEAKAALGALSAEMERIKKGQGNMHENKKTSVECGLPEALWQKLFSVAGGGK